MKYLLFTLLAITAIFFACEIRKSTAEDWPKPTDGLEFFGEEEDEEGEVEKADARERYEKLIHWTADSVDWQRINAENRMQLFLEKKQGKGGKVGSRSSETFAGGTVMGTWSERGSQNLAGSLRTVRYVADQNKVYGLSDGGSLFRANLDGTGWEVLEDDIQFDPSVLQILPNGGTKRILCAIGKQIWYTDDYGGTWTQATGLSYYDTWGSAKQLVALNDGNSVYFLVYTWNQSPWGSRIWLMYSSNKGQSFSKIHVFPHNGNYWAARHFTKIWSPYNSNELYALHLGTDRGVYSISGSTVSLLNAMTTIPENTEIRFTGYKDVSNFNLYALASYNTLYKSSDSGATWAEVGGALPVDAWDVGIHASPFDINKLFFGAQNCYRSYNQGSSWSTVNTWGQYYGNTNYLHADIMDIESFEKTNGTKFMLVCNHGGLHVSYDYLTTTTNIGLIGLNLSQYYDVRTDPTDPTFLYAGAQDQGHQRTDLGGNTGPLNFVQVVSGDYGEYSFSDNGNRLWTVYPFGAVQFRYTPKTGNSGAKIDKDILGSTPPAGDWIFPTAEFGDASQNKIYVAGGDMSGGDGSYLVTLTAQFVSSWSVTASQTTFDFNAASGKPISAIANSTVNTDRIFVATENGNLYYSNDAGSNWTAATTTNMSAYVNCVLPSKLDADLVWMSGNGYSSAGVVKSTNGGQTFSNMTTGLPATQVRSIVANTDETLLFAATDAGPYVFVVADDQWYSLIGAATPIQSYRSVEYVASSNTARFGTYGRGIWDFAVESAPLPLEWVSFTAKRSGDRQVQLDWQTASEQNVNEFIIERSADGLAFSPVGKMGAKGSGQYRWLDAQALPGTSFYRLRQIDFDGEFTFSPMRSITLAENVLALHISPNPIRNGRFKAYFEKSDAEVHISVWDLQGRLLAQQLGNGEAGVLPVELSSSAASQVVLVVMQYRGRREIIKGFVTAN